MKLWIIAEFLETLIYSQAAETRQWKSGWETQRGSNHSIFSFSSLNQDCTDQSRTKQRILFHAVHVKSRWNKKIAYNLQDFNANATTMLLLTSTSWTRKTFSAKGIFFIFITNTWKYQLQCNQANYIRFLVHFVTAGPIINIKFNRERDFNACALYYWIPLNCGPWSCIVYLFDWSMRHPTKYVSFKLN